LVSSIYDHPAWRLIDPVSRKCLISVLEGVVPGTEVHPAPDYPEDIDAQLSGVERICKSSGLYHRRTTCPENQDYSCIDVSFEKGLLEYSLGKADYRLREDPIFRRLENRVHPDKLEVVAGTIKLGRFYGYPGCCIEKYAKGIGLGDEGVEPYTYEKFSELCRRHNDSWIYRNRAAFWGAFLEHVPCSLSCEGSETLAGSIWAAVDRVDPELSHFLFKEQLGRLG
jgi:hypothetical protein